MTSVARTDGSLQVKVFRLSSPQFFALSQSRIIVFPCPQLLTANIVAFKYRIDTEPNARPAPIGSLQIGNAADSRRFQYRLAQFPGAESGHQIGYRTSCRAARCFPGSALGASSQTRESAACRATASDRSSRTRARSEHAASPRRSE